MFSHLAIYPGPTHHTYWNACLKQQWWTRIRVWTNGLPPWKAITSKWERHLVVILRPCLLIHPISWQSGVFNHKVTHLTFIRIQIITFESYLCWWMTSYWTAFTICVTLFVVWCLPTEPRKINLLVWTMSKEFCNQQNFRRVLCFVSCLK